MTNLLFQKKCFVYTELPFCFLFLFNLLVKYVITSYSFLVIYLILFLAVRFCTRSLIRESLDYGLIDRIPGRQTDRKTPLGELNWILTAVTDTIAWNPRGNVID